MELEVFFNIFSTEVWERAIGLEMTIYEDMYLMIHLVTLYYYCSLII